MFRIRETREVERKFDTYLRNDKDEKEKKILSGAELDRLIEMANSMVFAEEPKE